MSVFYTLSAAGYKLSLLLLYKRIFSFNRFARLIHAAIALLLTYNLAFVFTGIFGCSPPSVYWTGQGHCDNLWASAIAFNVLNILMIITIWVMPIPMLWRIQLPKGQKIALSFIFLLALL